MFVCGFVRFAAAAEMSLYNRDGFDRIVIDGAGIGQARQQAAGVSVSTGGMQIANIESAKTSTAVRDIVAENKTVTFVFSNKARHARIFKIGNRLVIDIFIDPNKAKEPEIATEDALEALTETPIPADNPAMAAPESNGTMVENNVIEETLAEVAQEFVDDLAEMADQGAADIQEDTDEEISMSGEDAATKDGQLPETAEAAPELPLAETVPAAARPTIITVSSVTPFSLAVFERYGRLFFVTDKPDMTLPPQIAGAGRDLGWVITDVPMNDGKAWAMDLPPHAYIRPEGGGLLWRVIISDQNPELDGVSLRRRFDDPLNPAVNIMMKDTVRILRLTDPDYGDDLAVFTVSRAASRMAAAHDFVDFDILPAIVGAVIKPESDGVQVSSTDQYITIAKKGGLILSPESQNAVISAYLNDGAADAVNMPVSDVSNNRVFFFEDWSRAASDREFIAVRQELDQTLVKTPKDEKITVIFDLVKLTLARAMGQEALGYLDLARSASDQITETPEYKAMKGAAHFLSGQYDLATNAFADESLQRIGEIRLWDVAAMSASGQGEDALKIYADNAEIASVYPPHIRARVIAPIAQAMIDAERGEDALDLVAMIDVQDKGLSHEDKATFSYLRGVAQNMAGYPDKAVESLYKASLSDKLGSYGVRSEMLLIEDELLRDVITIPEAIKRMERLRFAWRGDALEAKIYHALGQLYIRNKQPRSGLSILKRAAAITRSVKERRDIVRTMAGVYKQIFHDESFNDLDPMEAIAIYDEFKELTPVGEEGNLIIDRLADKLMAIDLMTRAVTVLQDKMQRLEGGEHAIKTGLRIAAVQLIDRRPEAAMETLETVDGMMMPYDGDNKDDLYEKIVLLKARALSDMGQADDALFMTEGLPNTDDVLRLRVDTAWRAGDWVAVSDNLGRLLVREDVTLSAPPTEKQAQMILNQAIALNLSDQYDAVQRFAAEYDLIMKQTPTYKTFQLVTRPFSVATLSDRETLMDLVSEVDLFQNFLDSTTNVADHGQGAQPTSGE